MKYGTTLLHFENCGVSCLPCERLANSLHTVGIDTLPGATWVFIPQLAIDPVNLAGKASLTAVPLLSREE